MVYRSASHFCGSVFVGFVILRLININAIMRNMRIRCFLPSQGYLLRIRRILEYSAPLQTESEISKHPLLPWAFYHNTTRSFRGQKSIWLLLGFGSFVVISVPAVGTKALYPYTSHQDIVLYALGLMVWVSGPSFLLLLVFSCRVLVIESSVLFPLLGLSLLRIV